MVHVGSSTFTDIMFVNCIIATDIVIVDCVARLDVVGGKGGGRSGAGGCAVLDGAVGTGSVVSGACDVGLVAEMCEVTFATVPGVDKVWQHLGVEVALEPAVFAATPPVTAPTLIVAITANDVCKTGAVPQRCAVNGARSQAPWARYAVILEVPRAIVLPSTVAAAYRETSMLFM